MTKRKNLLDIGLKAMADSKAEDAARPVEDSEGLPGEPEENTRSWVGKMLDGRNEGLEEENTRLRGENAVLATSAKVAPVPEGSVVLLDAKRVRRTPFADRHARAFMDDDFQALCEQIIETGGNTEPGQVRPVQNDPDHDYEIASGHRRHAACLKLSLPFRAIVREMTDAEMLRQMHMENNARLNLSDFEKGRHYVSIVDLGVFTSLRAVASGIGEDRNKVRRLARFADIPDFIVEAFAEPREIRIDWVDSIVAADKADHERVKRTVDELNAGPPLKSLAMFQRIADIKPRHTVIAGDDKVLGRIRTINGCPAVVLHKEAPEELLKQISELIRSWSNRGAT